MRLGDNLGLKTHNTVLDIMVKKVASNLQEYGSCETVISATLNLFQVLNSLPLNCSFLCSACPVETC